MNREPIAIIGIGCRFPGANNPEGFWQLLRDGVDAISEMPEERWTMEFFNESNRAKPDKTQTHWGGFVEGVDQFEPEFFGISPREAASIDPQQRLLLEVAWEALEDAGQIPESLSGTQTGVFIGIGTHDYSVLTWSHPVNEAHALTGTGNCIAANRISYLFNFHGPSLAVDTACSSSLVAVHLACQSLWSGESKLALAGGVNVLLLPTVTIGFAKAGFLSADGRCQTFDAGANGYVRGEGAGVVVLKPLSQAQADGDPIYAFIRGCAINQDGRSNGLTAPNPQSQVALLREAYRQAGVSPGQVQYIEAHGTGTKLGDPIEMKALGAVLAQGRPPGNKCAVGSVKTNIGHLETAAGIAGLIKVALSLKHRQIPPSLHFHKPNPYIPFDKLPLRVQQTLGSWSKESAPVLAGVSSFSFGGTNAHLVLQEVSVGKQKVKGKRQKKQGIERPVHLLTLSAKSQKALRELAQGYEGFLGDHPEVAVADICFTANTRRSNFDYRLAVIAESTVQLRQRLRAWVTLGDTAGVVRSQVRRNKILRLAFLFTGQGSQYGGMGRQLDETQPTFRAALDRCDQILHPYLGKRLRSILYSKSAKASLLDQTVYTQPALFALEYALVQLWQSWGIEPTVVMGHSLGEYVAATVAGVFSLEDGLKLICERARLMQNLPGNGEMVAVFASESAIRAVTDIDGQRVAFAADNGSQNTVLSGERQEIQTICASLEKAGIQTQKLQTSHAFHSPLMEPMLSDFERVASQVTYSLPRIDFISNVTGQQATSMIATPEYWCRHIRQSVRFATSMETLKEQGYEIFVEIGPRPILLGMGRHCLPDIEGVWLPSLRQDQPDWQQLLASLSRLYACGIPVDWSGFDQNYPRHSLHQLPTYPFARSRYWLPETQHQQQSYKSDALHLWESVVSAGLEQAQQCPLDLALPTYLGKQESLQRLTTAYMIETLCQLGAYSQVGENHSVESLIHTFNILSAYRPLLSRWLKQLTKAGFLREEEGERFVCDRPLPRPQLSALMDEVREYFTDAPFLLDYLLRCGTQLKNILLGHQTPLETLFPGGTFDTAENLYQTWAVARYFNRIARSVIESVVKVLPPRKHLQLLEIGAGIGGTTASLLPILPPERTTYYFTDVSDVFLKRATQKFQTYAWVHYSLFDIEQNPQQAGYNYQSFDVIIATNVLHATRNLEKTLEYSLSLLRPGGLLVLNEITHHASWLDISMGLMESWQVFEDSRRQYSPLLSRKKWENLLQDYGLEKVVSFPESGSPAEILGQHLLVAQVPGELIHSFEYSTAQITSRNPLIQPTRKLSTYSVDEQQNELPITLETLLATAPEKRQQILEQQVSQQVANLLRISPTKLHREQPLKTLGLDSLIAIELKNGLEVNWGFAVANLRLFPELTVSKITQTILNKLIKTPSYNTKNVKTKISPSTKSLVSVFAIQDAGSKPAFLCIHPGGVDISCYVNLAQYLTHDQPFYVLQLPEFNQEQTFNNEQLFSSIPEIATQCIAALSEFPSQSPYVLGGWSLGGYVAFEMAQQLYQKGYPVALLTLLDIANLPNPNHLLNQEDPLIPWFASYLGVRRNKELLVSYNDLRGLDLNEQLNYVLNQAIIAEVVAAHTPLSEIDHFFQVYKKGVQVSLELIQDYKPQIYPQRLTLFQAIDILGNVSTVEPDSLLNREILSKFSTQPLDLHRVPGNHYTMLIEPHVQMLAQKLERCLSEVNINES